MTFCFCIDDDTHVVVHDDVIHRDYSRVINKCGKKKIVNPDTRQICEPYEHGEICAKTNRHMMSYLNMPKSAYFDDDGFGMTGDIGYYNENGVVFYVDRFKEIIKLVNRH